MGLFTRKKEKIYEEKSHEVDGAEVWLVSWKARYGNYHGDWTTVAKAFLNLKDAQDFKNNLLEAAKLLQYTEYLNISIHKQV